MATRTTTERSRQQRRSSASPSTKNAEDDYTFASTDEIVGVRIRMYRVGFGDFFLLTVTGRDGPKHILIDCGVHAKNIGSIGDAIDQMAKDCNFKLALIIMTHRHADHISGFATCANVFAKFTVEAVWMPWFENPAEPLAVALQANLTEIARRASFALAALADEESAVYRDMAENITGVVMGVADSSNQVALNVLHGGFKNKPNYFYYKAGDVAELPQSLVDTGVRAKILGPPIDPLLIRKMTKKSEQYLSDGLSVEKSGVVPFKKAFIANESDYPKQAFDFFNVEHIKEAIDKFQPSAMAAAAREADKYLNNQSLVVLFTIGGKNLLFSGDAQRGNWENFLYGGVFGTPGHTELCPEAKAILGNIDFYKVGHHGSANATPKEAVSALRLGCVGMCSTAMGAYNEVPRGPLLNALMERMNGQLARSDQVATDQEEADAEAGPLASLFKTPKKKLFIDFEF